MKLFLNLLLIGILLSSGLAQKIPINKKEIPLSFEEIWTKELNQSLSSVQTILQTKDGYLWFGSNNGLFRYNGAHFNVYNSTSTKSLKSNVINALAEDNEGTLWIGTDKGLFYYNKGQLYPFESNRLFQGISISSLAFDNEDNLYIGTSDHTLIKLTKDKKFINYSQRLKKGTIRTLCFHNNALFFSIHGIGIMVLKNDSIYQILKKYPFTSDPILTLFFDKDDNLWIGTSTKGLYKYKDGQLKSFSQKDGLPSDRIMCINQDRDGSLWIGTGGGGLVNYKDGVFKTYTTNDGLTINSIRSIYFDYEGVLWVGTVGGGVNKIKSQKVINYTTRDGLSDDLIWSIFQDKNDNILLATANNGVVEITKDRIKYITKKDGLPSNNIRVVFRDSQNRLWIGTYSSGLVMIENNKKNIFNENSGFLTTSIRALYEDSKGRVWVSSNAKTYIYENNKMQLFTTKDLPNSIHSRMTLEDKLGNIWFAAGSSGVFKWDGKKVINYSTKNGLSSNDVISLYFDKDNTLWIATGNGLNRLKNNIITKINFNNIFDNQLLLYIVEDDYRNLWISSFIGLIVVNIDELNLYADGKIDKINSIIIGKKDGMLSTECNGANQYAGLRSKDGRIWFPTYNGISVIDPDKIFKIKNNTPPKIVIEKFAVDFSDLNIYSSEIEITPGSHSYEFHYAALSFANPGLNRYKYKLDGYDKDWIDASNRTQAYYTNLPKGTYTFKVKAANSDGVWNEEGAFITFTVLPHFYEKSWFIPLVVIFLVVTIYGTYKYRVSSLHKTKIKLQEIVKKQTEELEKELNEIKIKEAQLKESRDLLQFYIEGSKDAFWDWDIISNKISFSHKAKDILRCDDDKLPKKIEEINNLIHPEDKEKAINQLKDYLNSSSEKFEIEYRIITPDKKIVWIFDRGMIIARDENNKPIRMTGSITDITERKRNEEELLKIKKIESIGLLAGGIAHDFNNLLTAILGNISLIKYKIQNNDNKNLLKLLENSEIASLRAKDLTQQLLTFAKGGQPIIKTVSINKLLTDCATFTLRGTKVKPYFDIHKNLWKVDIDEGQINQVIQNIIVNAMQAMPDGGNIYISSYNERISESIASRYRIEPGDYVRINIQDTGKGIPKENFDKIFDPYFTTKEKGHGLGLYTCYSIIKKHNGHISFDSELGVGTIFKIWLPKTKNNELELEEYNDNIKYGNGLIFLFGKEKLAQNILKEMILNLGYNIEKIIQSNELLEKIKLYKEKKNKIDLIIINPYSISDNELIDLINKITELDSNSKILLSYDHIDAEFTKKFNLNSIKDFLQKPFKLEEVSNTIFRVINGNT
jgi:PAS domain S-box-containing protein